MQRSEAALRGELARLSNERLEELAGCPIVLVSVGPRRDQTMMLKNPFGE
jgi:adenylosuccinate synthase